MMRKVADIFKTMEYGPAPESDKDVMAWLEGGERKFMPFINGEFVKGKREFVTITAPGDGRKLAEVAQSTQKDVDNAIKAAREAQESWAKLSGFEKGKYIYALARAMYDHARSFEVVESLDNGKPFRETHNADIPLAIKHLDNHADFANVIDSDPEFRDYEPYGVVGQIIPWNFPLVMLVWKISVALASGNTIVLKPSEQTPLSAMKVAELCYEIGLPEGVVNIVPGDGKVGAMITEATAKGKIDKIAFTGSTEVGRIIRKATAGSDAGITLELGGKSPFIIMDDADLDSAADGVVDAIWFNQGEVCCGGSRILVHEAVHDKFIEKLRTRMSRLRIGGPLDKSIDMGAVVDRTQWERINGFVEGAKADGAEIFQPHGMKADSCFYPPTLVTKVNTTHRIVQEEVFGPVVTAMSFRTHDEAVELANNTRYGLAASVWSESASKLNEISSRLKCGVVWQNGTNKFDGMAGFGGYRESGYGREGGREGIFAYMKHKSEVVTKSADVSAPETEYKSRIHSDGIDQTRKFYIGGAEKRPDGGDRSLVITDGFLLGRVGKGNRKDIREAVKAAKDAEGGWAGKTPYQRGQVLKFIAERLDAHADQVRQSLQDSTGCSPTEAQLEVQQSLRALFNAAAWASKHEGVVHRPSDGKTIIPALNEYIGVIGIAAPNEKPLLSFVTMVSSAIAMGNTVIAVPSEKYPLPAMDLTQIFRTSDVPGGVINIIAGNRDELSKVLAQHDNVDAMWYHGSAEGSKMVEQEAAMSNLKQTWVNCGKAYDWDALATTDSKILARRATQVKNIWVPWSEGITAG
jgi:aldehyde dehydrogenase (NAD+)